MSVSTHNSCVEYVELFPYLKDPVIENTTIPEYTMCHSHFKRNVLLNYAPAEELNEIVSRSDANEAVAPTNDEREVDGGGGGIGGSGQKHKLHQQKSASALPVKNQLHQQPLQEQLFSGGRIYGLRVIFKPASLRQNDTAPLLIRGEYAFLDRANFKNDGRLIPGTFCDYYFFAEEQTATANATPTVAVANETNNDDVWKYFHSPRYPANYAAHIQCTYKFIGRPDMRVEVIFAELIMPKNQENCNLDKVTIYDAESPNVSSIIDVICETVHNKRIYSNGPDLLIEFNASSNQTTKGFRGKFKFVDAIKLKKNKTSWIIANPKLNEVFFQESSHSHRSTYYVTNGNSTGSGSSSLQPLMMVNPLLDLTRPSRNSLAQTHYFYTASKTTLANIISSKLSYETVAKVVVVGAPLLWEGEILKNSIKYLSILPGRKARKVDVGRQK